MKTNKRLISLHQFFVILAFLGVSCNKDEPIPKASISEFSPTSGVAGTTVVITGKNFSSDPAKNTVHFNGTKAEVSQASFTSLIVTVPDNATTGKISVMVHGKTATSAADFVVLKPSITGFTPTEGPTGTTVFIAGTDFSPEPAKNAVTFNGIAAEVIQATATSLTVTVPEGATTGKISITAHGKTVSSEADFIVLEPSITGFSPARGIVGTTVTITGVGFSPEPAENRVKFNDVFAEVAQATTASLTVTVPEGATTGPISVTVHGVTIFSETDFVVLEPTLKSFSPTEGLVGTTVTITGKDFNPTPAENIVTFNETPAEVVQATTTSLTVTVPNEATTGKISITVHGKTITSDTDFTVLEPSITGFSPTEGIVGTPVTITGRFFPKADKNIVRFNGIIAEVIQSSAASLSVTVPKGATTGKISVTVNGQTITSDSDFSIFEPSFTGFSPTEGVAGTTVTLTGRFIPEADKNIVQFNGVTAEVLQASATALTVTVPGEASTGKISVTVNENSFTSDVDFIILEPVITDFEPKFVTPDITVKLTGSNFSPAISQNIVKFNGVEATVTEASSTYLKVNVPSGVSPGKISVKVGPNTATSTEDFAICNGFPELVITNFEFSDFEATICKVSLDLINVGSEPLNLATMIIDFLLSTDADVGGDKAVSGTILDSGGVLETGEKFQFIKRTIGAPDFPNYPYLVVRIRDKTGLGVTECSKGNNIVVVKIE